MEQRYNVYFAGQILEGHQQASVRTGLGRLFKADEATLDKLFSGKAQLIKKDCDKATALKYKQAMEKAGAKPLIKALKTDTPAAPPPPPPPEPRSAQSAAEKIAALAAGPDAGESSAEPPEPPAPPPSREVDNGSLDLCPDGTEVLRPEERPEPVQAQVDTAGLEVDAAAQRLSEEPPPAPPAPDTDHLAMGEVGETIPTLPPEREPLNPNTDGIALSPEGTDFSDCNAPDAPPPDLDLSAIDLAPAGTEVLKKEERGGKPAAPPPDTDHIKLSE